MTNYLPTSDGRSMAAIQRRLSRYLPGLDAPPRLLRPTQAVLRAPLLRAIGIDCPSIDSGPPLAVLDVTRVDTMDDEVSGTLVALHDTARLPSRVSMPRPAGAASDPQPVQARQSEAWSLQGKLDSTASGRVKVSRIHAGCIERPALGFPARTCTAEAYAMAGVSRPRGNDGSHGLTV